MSRTPKRYGLSLLELVVVLAILAALASVVVPLVGSQAEEARRDTTRETLHRLRDIIVNQYWLDAPNDYPRMNEGEPANLSALFLKPAHLDPYDPVLRRGWNGPYLVNATGHDEQGNPVLLDGWGTPIVLQEPDLDHARLVSAGPSRVINTPPGELHPTKEQQGDDIVVFLRFVGPQP